MRVTEDVPAGEIYADAYDGEGDPSFYGSISGRVVVDRVSAENDRDIEAFVQDELDVCYARVINRYPNGCAIVQYADF